MCNDLTKEHILLFSFFTFYRYLFFSVTVFDTNLSVVVVMESIGNSVLPLLNFDCEAVCKNMHSVIPLSSEPLLEIVTSFF